MAKVNKPSEPQKGSQPPLGNREPIVERCYTAGADGDVIKCRKAEGDFCSVFLSPAAKWRIGDCPLADDFLKTKTEKKAKEKTRVGQQKQKK
jgi:hypothetical protein